MPSHTYKNPESYSKNNSLQYNFAMQVLEKTKIYPKDRVLDLGCGDGRITAYIATITNEGCVIGTDISEKMTEHANTTYHSQTNLRFLPMDTSNNIFKNQFDVITSFNSLHWIKDQEKALKGITAAASNNARIVLLLSHRKSSYHQTLDTVCANSKWASYFKEYINPRLFFTKEQYRNLLLSAKLEISSLEEREMTYEFKSISKLKLFLSASMSNIKQIPVLLKNDFLEDFCTEFLKTTDCKNINHIPVSFWCLEVFASKRSLDNKNEATKQVSFNRLQSKL